MAQYADTIAARFIANDRMPKSTRLYPGTFTPDQGYIGNVNTTKPDAPRALYSYGPHYPVVIEDQSIPFVGYWLNETPYYVNDTDRWESGWSTPRYRKPSASPTTRGHRQSVESVLNAAGYVPTSTVKTIDTEGTNGDQLTHTFRLWVRD